MLRCVELVLISGDQDCSTLSDQHLLATDVVSFTYCVQIGTRASEGLTSAKLLHEESVQLKLSLDAEMIFCRQSS